MSVAALERTIISDPVRSCFARAYLLAWLFVLASTLLSPAVLFAVLVWPTWLTGWRAGERLADFHVSRLERGCTELVPEVRV